MFLNSGSEAIDGALKLARRVTGRPGIIAFRGGFHGRTYGATSVTTSNLNYRTGYEPLLPGVYFAPYPDRLSRVRRRRGGGVARRASTILRSLLATVIAPSMVGSILIEPVLGEGGYVPAPAAFLRGAARRCATSTASCSSPTRSSRATGGPGRMWALRARRHRPGRRVRGQGDRQRPAAVGDRVVARAPGALGSWRARLDVRREPGRLRRRPGGARDDPRRGPRRERRRRAAPSCVAGLGSIAAEDDRIGDIRGPGLMIGVEFVRDRATARAGRRAAGSADGRLRRRRPAGADLRPQPRGRALDPAARRHARPRSPRRSRSSGRRSRRSRGPEAQAGLAAVMRDAMPCAVGPRA